MKPRHADLFAGDLGRTTLIRTIDRVLMFYIRTADRLHRASGWLDNLEQETSANVLARSILGRGW